MSQSNSEHIEHQLARVENRLDDLSTKLDTYQYANLQLIHQIDKKVDGHQKTFDVMKYLMPGSGLLAIFAVFKDYIIK